MLIVFGLQRIDLLLQDIALGFHVGNIFADVNLRHHEVGFATIGLLEPAEVRFTAILEITAFGGGLLDVGKHLQLVFAQLAHMHAHGCGTFHAPLRALVIRPEQ